jgi:hypothetical protein
MPDDESVARHNSPLPREGNPVSEATEYAQRYGVADHKQAHWSVDVPAIIADLQAGGKPAPERLDMGRATYLELLEGEGADTNDPAAPDTLSLYGVPVHIEDVMPYRLARVRQPRRPRGSDTPEVLRVIGMTLANLRRDNRPQPHYIEMTEGTAAWLALTLGTIHTVDPGHHNTLFGIPVRFNESLPFGTAQPAPVTRYPEASTH